LAGHYGADVAFVFGLGSSKLSWSKGEGEANGKNREKESAMAKIGKGRLTIDVLEPELDSLITSTRYFESISEELRKLVHKVFFIHAVLEGQLGMRIIYKLCEEQMKGSRGEGYCLTETMNEITRKLTYTQMLSMVREFNDGAPCGTLEKIHSVRNDFWHPGFHGWKDKYNNKASRVEILQLLIVGIKAMEEYMEKVRREAGM
jgi:hypothetical protein